MIPKTWLFPLGNPKDSPSVTLQHSLLPCSPLLPLLLADLLCALALDLSPSPPCCLLQEQPAPSAPSPTLSSSSWDAAPRLSGTPLPWGQSPSRDRGLCTVIPWRSPLPDQGVAALSSSQGLPVCGGLLPGAPQGALCPAPHQTGPGVVGGRRLSHRKARADLRGRKYHAVSRGPALG